MAYLECYGSSTNEIKSLFFRSREELQEFELFDIEDFFMHDADAYRYRETSSFLPQV
jgi:hypothetical protein